MKNYPLIKLIINILSNNSTRFFESYIKDFKLNLNNFSKDMRNFFGTIVPCAASSRRSESERTDTEQIHFRHIDRLHNVSSIEEILTSYISSHGRL